MNRIRLLLAGTTAVLLTAGYLASQRAYFGGTFAEYAAKVDQLPIVLLSLFLFIAAVALCFTRDKKESED